MFSPSDIDIIPPVAVLNHSSEESAAPSTYIPSTQAEEDDMLARAIALSLAESSPSSTNDPAESTNQQRSISPSLIDNVKVPEAIQSVQSDISIAHFSTVSNNIQHAILELRKTVPLPFEVPETTNDTLDSEDCIDEASGSLPSSQPPFSIQLPRSLLPTSGFFTDSLQHKITDTSNYVSYSHYGISVAPNLHDNFAPNESDSDGDAEGSVLNRMFADPISSSSSDQNQAAAPPATYISPLQISIRSLPESPTKHPQKPQVEEPSPIDSDSSKTLFNNYSVACTQFLVGNYVDAHRNFVSVFQSGNVDVAYHLAVFNMSLGFSIHSAETIIDFLILASTQKETASATAILFMQILKISSLYSEIPALSNQEFPSSHIKAALDSLCKFPTVNFDPFLMHLVGLCHFHGVGTQNDSETASLWFLKAAKLNFGPSHLYLAIYLSESSLISHTLISTQVYEHLTEAQKFGDVRASYFLAKIYDPQFPRCTVEKTGETSITPSNEKAIFYYLQSVSASYFLEMPSVYLDCAICQLAILRTMEEKPSAMIVEMVTNFLLGEKFPENFVSCFYAGLCNLAGVDSSKSHRSLLTSLCNGAQGYNGRNLILSGAGAGTDSGTDSIYHSRRLDANFLYSCFSWLPETGSGAGSNYDLVSNLVIDKEYLQIASTNRYNHATYILAQQAFHSKRYSRAFRLFSSCKEHLDSYMYLGYLLSNGLGMAIDHQEALLVYRKIADADPHVLAKKVASLIKPASYWLYDIYDNANTSKYESIDTKALIPVYQHHVPIRPAAASLDSYVQEAKNFTYAMYMESLLHVSQSYISGMGLPDGVSTSPSIALLYLSKVDSIPSFEPLWDTGSDFPVYRLSPFTKVTTGEDYDLFKDKIRLATAKLYYFGATGIKINIKKSYDILFNLENNPEANALLGLMQYQKKLPAKSAPEYLHFFKKSSSMGSYLGHFFLAQIYFNHKEYELAFAHFMTCVSSSLPSLPNDFENIANSTPLSRSPSSVTSYPDGYPPALFNLGVCYYHGLGTLQSFSDASQYFHKAALAGNHNAAFSLAKMFSLGQVINGPIRWDQVIRWASIAAKHNHRAAMVLLADCYYYGKGTYMDHDRASMLLAKASDQKIPALDFSSLVS